LSTLETELFHHRNYKTLAEAERDLFAFIDASTIESASIPMRIYLPIEGTKGRSDLTAKTGA
jgi:hypothetical protein